MKLPAAQTAEQPPVLEDGWKPQVDAAPLYMQVAHFLEERIGDGEFPVGTLLPTETKLAEALKVSRQTVRQAIGTLRQSGRLTARKGVGTRVEAQPNGESKRFVNDMRMDLMDVVPGTELRISEREEVAARGRLAVDLGCRPGRKFLHLSGLRYKMASGRPFSWNEVYVEMRLAPALKDVTSARHPLFHFIEAYTGERIHEIEEEVRPVQIPEKISADLGCSPADLGLQLTRRYYGRGRRLIEYAFQILPADRFIYMRKLRAD